MKACLVLVACILAVIPATTGLEEAVIKEDLHKLGLPHNFKIMNTYESVKVKTIEYLTGSCFCTSLQATVGVGGQVWRGESCSPVDATKFGFICKLAIDAVPVVNRWEPEVSCNRDSDCIMDKQSCIDYGIKKKFCLFTLQADREPFCPCEQ